MSTFCPDNRCLGNGTCEGFMHKWQRMQPIAPLGSGGNGIFCVNPPYGITPIKYTPSGSSSVGRQPWEGWRYGQGFLGYNPRQVYGKPDWEQYRGNYCGPCGCGPLGYMGDPNGQNPNIRYIQLDYNSLLGSGFAKQTQGQCCMSQTSQFLLGQDSSKPCPSYTSCGKYHCPTCSGVTKRKPEDVKFQVCIGEPTCPETMQPCPQNDVKVYVPHEMLPPCPGEQTAEPEVKPEPPRAPSACGDGRGDDAKSCDGSGDGEDKVKPCVEEVKPKKLQDYEIQIPQPCGPRPVCPMLPRKTCRVWEEVDPCGNCRACKTTATPCTNRAPCLVRPCQPPQKPCVPCCQPAECMMDGKRYTRGNVLDCVKRPVRPNMKLRKGNYVYVQPPCN